MAVGSTLAYVTPHVAGAIDLVAVRQPDGSIKTSPFYGELMVAISRQHGLLTAASDYLCAHPVSIECAVRFGKYTGSRATNRAVKIIVNGALCSMHVAPCRVISFQG